MTTQTVNLFDPVTGLFVCQYEAHESPLEPDVFHAPEHSTPLPVPALSANEVAIFTKNAWSVVPDFRGQIIYDQTTGASQEVADVGALPFGFGLTKPVLPETASDIDAAVLVALDKKARAKGYNDAATCVSYISSTNAKWAFEAAAMNAWRDQVWAYVFQQEAIVPLPSSAAVLAGLPAAPW